MEEFIKKMENEALIKSKYKEKLKSLLNDAKKESKGDYRMSHLTLGKRYEKLLELFMREGVYTVYNDKQQIIHYSINKFKTIEEIRNEKLNGLGI